MPKQYRKSALAIAQIAARAEKALDMAQRYEAGSTLQEIGNYYGITRERVRQLIKGELGMTGKDGGLAKRSAARRHAEAEQKDRRCLAENGMSRADYKRVRACLSPTGLQPQACFRQQRNNARIRSIPWQMTFAEWWDIWEKSGKWMERGRGRGYVMSRHGDKGPYATWNVRVIPAQQNNGEFIRRLHAEVKAGLRPPPKRFRTNPIWLLAVGETKTLPITASRPIYAQNAAYTVAKAAGFKVSARTSGGVLIVTRIT